MPVAGLDSTPLPDFPDDALWNQYYSGLDHVESTEFTPLPKAPSPEAVVSLAVMKAGDAQAPAESFEQGGQGRVLAFPDYAFYIEKQLGNRTKRYLFDLGLRKDGPNLSEPFATRRRILKFTSKHGVPEILEMNKIPLDSIDGIILSHTDWDHFGDCSAFPDSVDLVLGLGITKDLQELAVKLDVPTSALENRNIRWLERTDDWKSYGPYMGLDLFGDSSLLLLSSPGHRIGHTSCLVRISATDGEQWVCLCGDTCHSCRILAGKAKIAVYPKEGQRLWSVMDDLPEAYSTISKARRLDQEPNCIAWLAHDDSFKSLFEKEGPFIRINTETTSFDRLKNRTKS